MTQLPKIIVKSSKRLGRGYGSGKGGHTSSRGTKGQKARTKLGVLFEGTKTKKSFIKRLPFRRGKDKFKAKPKPLVINLDYLNLLPAGTKVTIETLVQNGLVRQKDAEVSGVKILGDGEITKKLSVLLPISKSAAQKIQKAGGSVGEVKESKQNKKSEKDK